MQELIEIPASYAQRRLWLLDQLEPASAAYNIAAGFRLTGKLDYSALRRSVNEIARRHEILRTTFGEMDGEPVQLISAGFPLDLPVSELTAGAARGRESEWRLMAVEEARLPFDLKGGPLLRLKLLQLGNLDHILLVTMHHIIADGWSLSVFARELAAFYRAYSGRTDPQLDDLPFQYADYALWQRDWLQGEELQRQLSYWKRQLGGSPTFLELPTDGPRPAVRSFHGEQESLKLSAKLTAAIMQLGYRNNATPFMTLLSAFKLLLHRYTLQPEIIVGSPIAGRGQDGLENLIGFFLNTLVLRTDVSGDPTFTELLVRVRDVALEAYAHQDLPFERLLEELQPVRDLSITPLFQVFFNFLNVPDYRVTLPNLTVEMLPLPEVGAKFDLTLYGEEVEGQIDFRASYNAELFSRARIIEMLRQLERLLEQVVCDPDKRITEYSLVTPPAERVLPDPSTPLRDDWNGAVHTFLSTHAHRAPRNVAVVDKNETWTYEELNRRSNQLAHCLRESGVETGDIVAIYAHRSAPVVWALMGVLKAGAAFVMLDPAYPADRLIKCLALAQPRALVQVEAAGPLAAALNDFLQDLVLRRRIALPAKSVAEANGVLASYPAEEPEVTVGPEDLAYVAFTSGSTGMPKGILGRHGPLTHFTPWLAKTFDLSGADRFTMLSGLAHDPLHRDVFTPLQLGASICIPDPDDIGVPGRVGSWMRTYGATITHLTPAMSQIITEGCPESDEREPSTLRYAFLVGDVLTLRDVGRLRAMAPSVRVVNYYGSTETQRAVGYYAVADVRGGGPESGIREKEILPLGKGIEDVQLLVMGSIGRLAGIGELGEIYLRSPHLARGYLGDESLTAERFLTNPFTGAKGDRIYRTGDLGRYRPDGIVDTLGRADDQVKIRGFRVELGEIEAVLRQNESVAEAVVIARQDRPGEKTLVGCVVAKDGRPASSAELRSYLKERLPDYMIPATFVVLDSLPVTPNGKVDRRALLELSLMRQEAGLGYEAPTNSIEETLAEVWKEVLGLSEVGRHDNFFELGGHSLAASQVIHRVRSRFHIEIAFRTIFEMPTIQELGLAVLLRQAEQLDETVVRQMLDEIELLPEDVRQD